MNPIKVDTEKCIGCGLCVKDCPATYLSIVDGKCVPSNGGCIECGHCFAVCPTEAVEMTNYDTSDCEAVTNMDEIIDSQKFLGAIKSRRTIRQYKDTEIEEEKLNMILEAGRYSPTAANGQKLTFTVLDENREEIEKKCVSLFSFAFKFAKSFDASAKRTKIDDKFFFKGAPAVILISGKNPLDGGIAAGYMELMANSLGLGVLYSGFFQICYALSPKVRRLCGLPKGEKLQACMIIGYPNVKYKRTVPRKKLNMQER